MAGRGQVTGPNCKSYLRKPRDGEDEDPIPDPFPNRPNERPKTDY